MKLIGKEFKNARLGIEIHVYEIEGKEWFIGKDMVKLLGYSEKSKPLRRWGERGSIVWEENKNKMYVKTIENTGMCAESTSEIIVNNNVTFINECGLYQLVFGSTLDGAKEFQKWVFSEVLPSIRKNNYYINEDHISEEQYNKLITRVKEISQQNENFSNILINNTRKSQSLKTYLEQMFPTIKDVYTQFLDNMKKSKMLDENYYPTSLFSKHNEMKNIFKYHQTIGFNKTETFSLTNIGMEELAQRLYVEEGMLKIKKEEPKDKEKILTLF
ncbi:MAG: BRO-N domain-containing protein [Clostridium sp.]|uniref:BRO-N domain-containing protein n=1 Tax=Clostridium sp. TaxID=1506 RepID=UPI003EE5BF06